MIDIVAHRNKSGLIIWMMFQVLMGDDLYIILLKSTIDCINFLHALTCIIYSH